MTWTEPTRTATPPAAPPRAYTAASLSGYRVRSGRRWVRARTMRGVPQDAVKYRLRDLVARAEVVAAGERAVERTVCVALEQRVARRDHVVGLAVRWARPKRVVERS